MFFFSVTAKPCTIPYEALSSQAKKKRKNAHQSGGTGHLPTQVPPRLRRSNGSSEPQHNYTRKKISSHQQILLHPAQERSPIPYSITRAAYTNKQKKQISAPNYLHRNSSQGAPHLDPENKHELHKVASPGAVIKKRKEKTPTPAKPVESSSTYRHGWTAPSRGPDPPGKWRARGWEATTAAAETKRKGRGRRGG